jgi:hypothetical protein
MFRLRGKVLLPERFLKIDWIEGADYYACLHV